MPRTQPFQGIATAPRDVSLIEVRHGPDQEIVKARWAGQNQAFIGDDDPQRKTLHRVTSWRPAREVPQTKPVTFPVVQEATMPAKIDPPRRKTDRNGSEAPAPTMTAPYSFRIITTAPTDRPIEVLHGTGSVTLAQWDAQLQVWVKVGDLKQRALRRVTGWRRPTGWQRPER